MGNREQKGSEEGRIDQSCPGLEVRYGGQITDFPLRALPCPVTEGTVLPWVCGVGERHLSVKEQFLGLRPKDPPVQEGLGMHDPLAGWLGLPEVPTTWGPRTWPSCQTCPGPSPTLTLSSH